MHRTQTVQTARAVAEKTRLKGKAEARALAAVGEAEATKMRLKANAYQRFVQLFEYFVSLVHFNPMIESNKSIN